MRAKKRKIMERKLLITSHDAELYYDLLVFQGKRDLGVYPVRKYSSYAINTVE